MTPVAEYQPQLIDRGAGSIRPTVVWIAVALGAWMVVATIAGAPVLLAGNHTGAALFIYQAFSRLCHQIPNRSFFIDNHPFAVCARCTGLYVGFAIGVTLYPLIRPLKNLTTPPRALLFLAAIPIVVDFALGAFGIWDNTHLSRFFTGALLSFVSAFYVLPGLIEVSLGGLKLWRSGESSYGDDPGHIEFTTMDQSKLTAAASDYKAPWRRI